MIKDTFFKILFITLSGVIIPLYANLVNFQSYTVNETILSIVFFIITSCIIWDGVIFIISHLRNRKELKSKIFFKLLSLSILSALYSITVAGAASLIWQKMFLKSFLLMPVTRCCALYGCVTIFIVPVYEAVFLSKERELDIKIVDQLDMERLSAEITALRNELDPHFIFNSLTTLSHLIHADADKAYLFNTKLAEVYKYFLINKDRELISLQNELEFIEDYFFLLKIRHDDKLHLNIDFKGTNGGKSMILPYALQVLVENAIKHNEFSENNPLHILIAVNKHYIHVTNNLKPKSYMVNSTNVGLKNLSHRYRLICNKDIIVESSNNQFAVKLPLITQ